MNKTEHRKYIKDTFKNRCKSALEAFLKNNKTNRKEDNFYKEKCKEEQEIISRLEVEDELIFASEVSRFLDNNNIPFYYSLHLDYSFIAYLLGITKINPLQWGLRNEMLYSFRKNRKPALELKVPSKSMDLVEGFINSVINKIGYDFYKGNPRKEGPLYWVYKDVGFKMHRLVFDRNGVGEDEEKELVICVSSNHLLDRVLNYYEKKHIPYASHQHKHVIFNRLQPSDFRTPLNNSDKTWNKIKLLLENHREEEIDIFKYLSSSYSINTIKDFYNVVTLFLSTCSFETVQYMQNNNISFEFTRDYIYEYCLKNNCSSAQAFTIMEIVRKGKRDCYNRFLSGFDNDFREICEGIQYLISRSESLLTTNILLFLEEE